MTTKADSNPDTRQRLLESACDLFAAKGFTKTTNKDICDRAEANIVAVNYYFGSKENLYAEAWRKAFSDNVAAHPPDGGVPPDAPPEERLRGRLRAVIHSLTDEDNQAFLIMHKEMANPTALLRRVKQQCLRPMHERTAKLVRELLGPSATEQQARFCEASVVAQAMAVIRHVRMRRDRMDDQERSLVIDDVDAYAEHVARFSLAGIRAIREQAEGGGADG